MAVDLKGKVALVTGGSAGLGAEVCRNFAKEGVNLAINYANSEERAALLAKELTDNFGVKVIIVQGDAFKGSKVWENVVKQVIEEFGSLDVVVSNAGWTKIVPFDDLDALDDQVWDDCYDINVKSHFFLYRAAKPYLSANAEGGTFLVTASMAGRMVYGSSLPYSVTKAALIHLVKGLAKTQKGKIRIHAVCPGILLTDWGKRFSPEKLQTAIDSSPLKKLADLEETADHYIFLSKLTSSTGTIVEIDGGLGIQ